MTPTTRRSLRASVRVYVRGLSIMEEARGALLLNYLAPKGPEGPPRLGGMSVRTLLVAWLAGQAPRSSSEGARRKQVVPVP